MLKIVASKIKKMRKFAPSNFVMRILVVLPRFPYPLEKGDKLRAYHQLKNLSQRHELYLVALHEGIPDAHSLDKVRPFCKEMHVIHLSRFGRLWNAGTAFLRGLPVQCGYFYNRKAQRTINELIDRVKPERIYCQLVRVAEYVKNANIQKTLDFQDVLSKGMQRRSELAPWYMKPFFNSEARRLARYERNIFSYFDEKVIITEVDRDLIPHDDSHQIHVIANGVDFDQYDHARAVEKKYDLIFSGNMNYPPNIDAATYLAKEVMPCLLRDHPELKLVICGANPAPTVQALASKNIIITGWVDDMAEYYAQSRIFIAPMRLGTGLQNKLLEAMSMKLPCITSPLAGAPLKGIAHGKEILVCSTTTGYVDAVNHLLEDSESYASIAESGHQFVRRNYNWEKMNQLLESVIIGKR